MRDSLAWLDASLHARGFSDTRARHCADVFRECDQTLSAMGAGVLGRHAFWVPGRLEMFGKHTDYAGGRSLLAAVERGFCMRAAPRGDPVVRVRTSDGSMTCELALATSANAPDGHWSNYVATVARRVALNFPDVATGVDIVFSSDLPLAAGVSSSTALMIGVFMAIAAVNRLSDSEAWQASLPTREDLAGYLGAVEMGGAFGALEGLDGVGTLGGSQDQTAILCAEPERVVDFAWMPVRRVGAYPLPAAYRFVIAASGVIAEKSAGARDRYNRASLMVRHLLASWNASTGRTDHSLAAAAECSPSAHDALREMIPRMATESFRADALRQRLDQFLLETYTLIPAAANALMAQDWPSLGDVAERSQHAAEEWLGNQIPETKRLVRLARDQGAIAASAFGAGFGGSVWALVPAAEADAPGGAFNARWQEAYRREFPQHASVAMFFSTAAGPAAMHWHDETGR